MWSRFVVEGCEPFPEQPLKVVKIMPACLSYLPAPLPLFVLLLVFLSGCSSAPAAPSGLEVYDRAEQERRIREKCAAANRTFRPGPFVDGASGAECGPAQSVHDGTPASRGPTVVRPGWTSR